VAESSKVSVVGGYTALRAAQRAAGKPATQPTPAREPGQQKKQDVNRQMGARLSHTTLPTKYEVVCYECGYSFQQAGRFKTTRCPKCRHDLEFVDYTIDKEWTDSIRTAGKVHLTTDAILKAGDILAGDIVLDGKISGGTATATRRLEIGPSGIFPEDAVKAQDLQINLGATVTLKRKAEFRNIDIAGTLKAKLYPSGTTHIRAGGLLHGEFHGNSLVIEEGGGLKGKIKLVPKSADDGC